jgi:hypothetical protein
MASSRDMKGKSSGPTEGPDAEHLPTVQNPSLAPFEVASLSDFCVHPVR